MRANKRPFRHGLPSVSKPIPLLAQPWRSANSSLRWVWHGWVVPAKETLHQTNDFRDDLGRPSAAPSDLRQCFGPKQDNSVAYFDQQHRKSVHGALTCGLSDPELAR
jgi:hypothetical protein